MVWRHWTDGLDVERCLFWTENMEDTWCQCTSHRKESQEERSDRNSYRVTKRGGSIPEMLWDSHIQSKINRRSQTTSTRKITSWTLTRRESSVRQNAQTFGARVDCSCSIGTIWTINISFQQTSSLKYRPSPIKMFYRTVCHLSCRWTRFDAWQLET